MAFSCSDFTDSILKLLAAHGVLKADDIDSDDPEQQAEVATAAINKLADDAARSSAPATETMAVASVQNEQAMAALFMEELLEAHETLTAIGEQHGNRTLADCMYLLSAVQKGTYIEHYHPSESQILDVVQSLPSAQRWMAYVHEVTK